MPNKPVDYVWVAPQDQFGTLARDFYKLRPDTVVVEEVWRDNGKTKIESLEGFIEAVKIESQHQPARNLILVAHANISGILAIKLFDDDKTDSVDSEKLLDVLKDSEKKRKLMIPGDLLNNTKKFLHIRGCLIGHAKNFLKLLRQVVGGQVHISGPKHWVFFGSFYEETGEHVGSYEHLMYDFRFFQTKKLSGPEEARSKLIENNFHFYDNTVVPEDFWRKITDDNFPHPPMGDKDDFSVPVRAPFIKQNIDITIQCHWYFEETNFPEPDVEPPVMGSFSLQGQPDPGFKKSEAEALRLRKELLARYLQKQKWFPIEYQRLRYRSAMDFMNGWNWVIKPIEGRPDELHYYGKRFEYSVLFPVTDLQAGRHNLLLANFYLTQELLNRHPKLKRKYRESTMLEKRVEDRQLYESV